MIFSRYLQQQQDDKSICDFTKSQGLLAILLWFKENVNFSQRLVKTSIQHFSHSSSWTLWLLKHNHSGAFQEAFTDHLVQPLHFKDRKLRRNCDYCLKYLDSKSLGSVYSKSLFLLKPELHIQQYLALTSSLNLSFSIYKMKIIIQT